MPDDTNTPGVFPGDMDNYTPAIIFLERYVDAAQDELDAAINALDQNYNTSKTNIESSALLISATLNAEMSITRGSVRDGYTSSGDALGDIEEPLVSLDKWVIGGLDYNPNKPDYNSPVYYYPGSWYNNKLEGGYGDEPFVRFNLAHEFTVEDDGIPTQFVGSVCHGLVLEREPHHFRAHTIQDGEVMAIIEDDAFFGNMMVIRQTDGLWARYYQLTSFVRWDSTGEHIPFLKVGDAVHAGDQLGLVNERLFVDVCFTDRLRLNYYDWIGSTLADVRANYLALDRVGTEDAPALYKTGTYWGGVDPDVFVYQLDEMTEGQIQTVLFRLNKPITEDVNVLFEVFGDAAILDETNFTFTPDDWYSARGTRIRADETDTYYADETLSLLFSCHSEGEFLNTITHATVLVRNDDVIPAPPGSKSLVFNDFPTSIDEAQAKVFHVQLGSKPTGTVTVVADSTHPDVLNFQWDWQGIKPSKKLVFGPENWFASQPLVIRCPARSLQSNQLVQLHVVANGGGYNNIGVIHNVSVKNINFWDETPAPPPPPPTPPPPPPPPDTPVVPADPVGFVETHTATIANLVWDASDDTTITGYTVKVNDAEWVDVPGQVTTYQVTGLEASTAYVIKLRAVNAVGNSGEVSVSFTSDASGGMPTNLRGIGADTFCTLLFDDPGTGLTPTYEVSINDESNYGDVVTAFFGTDLKCVVFNLVGGTEYTFYLRLKDGPGPSANTTASTI